MSRQSCTQYIATVENLILFGGSRKESSVRFAFQKLLDEYCQAKHLMLIPELDYPTARGKTVFPDGTIKDQLRMTWGWWESKDEADDLDEEIAKKLAKGYPVENILFEDSQTAVLIRDKVELRRVAMRDAEALDGILSTFLDYVRPEVASFRAAIDSFKSDIPTIMEALRALIEEGGRTSEHFRMERESFIALLRDSVNPEVTPFDVDEMLIQHLLTEEIFTTVFDDALFHRFNIMAHRIDQILALLLTQERRHALLDRIQPYYKVIKAAAAQIGDIHEKQKFLKVIYENFYQAYNPKGADRLGVVYTPNEIVAFMLEATDHLLDTHFGKLLGDAGVDILDPCTGTGTFVTSLIDRLPAEALKRKFATEIHANEIAILPYYIANLNIEHSYKQKVGSYEPFPGICFVDTLDNNAFSFQGKQGELSMGVGAENIERIRKQNERKISVVIGNPPYNANQQNENDNNKNRAYPTVDKRIKDSYIARSTAQKTKLYDMYARFLRWASDRIDKNGIVAFITNRSFIDARTFDGFRKVLVEEFDEVHVVDLGGDVRSNPKLSGTTHNVFGIQTGVAISFLVRKDRPGVAAETLRQGRVFYHARPAMERASEKLAFLHENAFSTMTFAHILPDKDGNWLNLTDNDWEELVPLASKGAKQGREGEGTIFRVFSLGVITNRDDWVYGFSEREVAEKVHYLVETYNQDLSQKIGDNKDVKENIDYSIKWTRAVINDLFQGKKRTFETRSIRRVNYRPFVKRWLHYSRDWNEMQNLTPSFYPESKLNQQILTTQPGSQKPFMTLATDTVADLHLVGAAAGAEGFPLHTYAESGERRDNITDWALKLFQSTYGPELGKLDIFHYVYAVLHDPGYRAKYEQNLKRDLPRVPLREDFAKWRDAGRTLMDLHIGFEAVEPWPLKVTDGRTGSGDGGPLDQGGDKKAKTVIRTDKASGRLEFEAPTGRLLIEDFPPAVWDYRLGNRSAVEWVLDQYADYTPKDKTVAQKFHTYKLAEHLDEVVELLKKVTRVSVETMGVVGELGQI